MMVAGYCARMGYGTEGSYASSNVGIDGLYKYFGYNENRRELSRDNYGIVAWENIIYDNLSTVGPVLYSGYGPMGGGHAFVCDGYQDGYYHFNWGWGGHYDGWFKLTALLPAGEDIGGNGSSNYSFRQNACINITTPDHVTIEADYNIHTLLGNLTGTIASDLDFYDGEYLKLSSAGSTAIAYNMDYVSHKFCYHVKYVAEDGEVQWGEWFYLPYTIPSNRGFSNVEVTIPETLQDGTYAVYLYYTLDDSDEKIPMGVPLGTVDHCLLTVQGGSYSVENLTAPELEGASVVPNSPFYLKSPFSVICTVVNNSDEELAHGMRPILYTYRSTSSVARRSIPSSLVNTYGVGEYRIYNLQPGESEERLINTPMTWTATSIAPINYLFWSLLKIFSYICKR